MTSPTITGGHGFTDDMTDASLWTENEAGGLSIAHSSNGDILTIACTPDNVADETAYLLRNITDISTASYPKCLIRWKTSAASNGCQLKMMFDYAVAGDQIETLGFSTDWKVSTITLTPTDTLQQISILLDDNPDTLAAGTTYVYIDFIIVVNTVYTIPYISDNIRVHMHNNYVDHSPVNRVGQVPHFMGAISPDITLSGTCDTNTSWEVSPRTIDLEVMYWLTHMAGWSDPWEWFESDVIECKVTIRDFDVIADNNPDHILQWVWTFKHYSAGKGQDFSYWFDWLRSIG